MHHKIARALDLESDQVETALDLLDADNTVPFIARYRKDATGGLDEVQIREVEQEADRLRQLESRRQSVLETIDEQGELDAELREAIESASTRTQLEDLYAPYRPKRRTKGKKAVDAGLKPVADAIRAGEDFRSLATSKTCEEYPKTLDVLEGARDIIAEQVADDPEVRKYARRQMENQGRLVCKKRRGADEDPNFEIYYDFSTSVQSAKPHQVLAIRRGEKEKALSAGVEVDEESVLGWIRNHVDRPDGSEARKHVDEACEDAWGRLLHPRTERHVRSNLEEEADAHAIGVFAVNLENLLLQPPLPGRRVMGIDPGYRTGCKVAIVDAHGRLEETDHIYVHDNREQEARETIARYLDEAEVDVVAIGNGTASRETEEVVAEAVSDFLADPDTEGDPAYAMVDEAGASVYSASESARREFPDLDVSMRGAISIARRLQDPLAELVKIDPKSIGVGMYQHDVDQNRLADELAAVVEDVVNSVGIDLNAASRELLANVSGIGPALAERIVEHREAEGNFQSRDELSEVRGIGSKTFEQAAGFLRIRQGSEPLDDTAIHPENYRLARALLQACDAELGSDALADALDRMGEEGRLDQLAERHDAGRRTLEDIVDSLTRPGRDPRDELDPPELRRDVLGIDDLAEGMQLTGTVRNVVDFGAFVDVGVKEDGLVHISEMADSYVDNPHEVVGVGDQIDVVVTSVDVDRGRIGLSIRRAGG